MSFGFATLVDLLSWIVAITLGAKAAATTILLARPASSRLATRGGRQ